MTKKKEKSIKIDLLPEDFVGNSYEDCGDCPVARAFKRHFTLDNILVGPSFISIYNSKWRHLEYYNIVNRFINSDFNYVKQQYRKDPKAKKVIYYVEVIKQ